LFPDVENIAFCLRKHRFLLEKTVFSAVENAVLSLQGTACSPDEGDMRKNPNNWPNIICKTCDFGFYYHNNAIYHNK
jgi:hypothetical protein